jgi:hypothetical protein
MLQGIHDKGHETIVTTYANYYQNEAIKTREFDLVIYDESHYLGQNIQGSETRYVEAHKNIASLPSGARLKIIKHMPDYPNNPHDYNYRFQMKSWNDEFQERLVKMVSKTKVIFFSATPFAYHKSIKYADGVLFNITETTQRIDPSEGQGYNESSGFDAFLCEHFGYRMKYNKCTIPETGVDVSLLERQFFENWAEKGVMSTRVLDLDFDYSRHFITLDSDLGEKINTGMELFYDSELKDKYPILCENVYRKYNYLYVNQLLECIKAKEILPRIKMHQDLGRKIVIFHTYNNSVVSHPFKFEAIDILHPEDVYRLKNKLEYEIECFEEEFSEYVQLDLSDLMNTRDAIESRFPNVKFFNGTVPKKKRAGYIDDFQIDYSFSDMILVQTRAGREGISLHDKTGEQQRVSICLGLPTVPSEAIQQEGRTYRSGLFSNAIYEYATLQTNFERFAFATKIAERSRTVENLAMGNLARDLETAFKEGYIGAEYGIPPSIEQGFGGKETDRVMNTISDFEKAKTFYWAKGKVNAKNKSKLGKDYFSTPEPLGFKMVEWLNPKAGDQGMEPSGGHGAIARWFPGDTRNAYVEQSLDLASELALNAKGEVHTMSFLDYHIINKFDFIAMNPPFGVGGKDAFIHLAKAMNHLKYGRGTLLAIVPCGPAMDNRLNAFYEDKIFKGFQLTGEILLPSVTFSRAGTKVYCKLLRFINRGRQGMPFEGWGMDEVNRIDLSHLEEIGQFFDELEHLEFEEFVTN